MQRVVSKVCAGKGFVLLAGNVQFLTSDHAMTSAALLHKVRCAVVGIFYYRCTVDSIETRVAFHKRLLLVLLCACQRTERDILNDAV